MTTTQSELCLSIESLMGLRTVPVVGEPTAPTGSPIAIGVSCTLSVADAETAANVPEAKSENDNRIADETFAIAVSLTMNRIDLELYGLEDFSPLGIRMDKA